MSKVDRTTAIQVPISIGELLDKITILELKKARIVDEVKQFNVTRELAVLVAIADESLRLGDEGLRIVDELRRVNSQLWDVEDNIRACERHQDFGNHFVELARSVYRHNDKRALLKQKLNEITGSKLVEEKSYSGYGTRMKE